MFRRRSTSSAITKFGRFVLIVVGSKVRLWMNVEVVKLRDKRGITLPPKESPNISKRRGTAVFE